MIFIYFHHPSSISNHQTSNAPLKKTVLRHKDPWKLWLPPPAPVVPAPAWPGWSALLWPCGPEWRQPTGPTGPRSACRCPKDLGSPRGTPTLEPSCRKSLQLAGWRSPGAWWRDSTSSANTFGQNASRVHVAYVVRMLMFWPTAWAKTCGWPIGQHAKNAYNFKTDLHQLCTIIVEFYIKLQAGTICKFPSQHPPTGNICQIICKYSPPKKTVHECPRGSHLSKRSCTFSWRSSSLACARSNPKSLPSPMISSRPLASAAVGGWARWAKATFQQTFQLTFTTFTI